MTELRLFLAGTVMVVLLSGLGGAVSAQDDEAEEVCLGLSPVTGTTDYQSRHPGRRTATYDEDRKRYRGGVEGRVIEVDDPRLSGTMWSTWNDDAFPDPSGQFFGTGGAIATGSAVLVNEDGSWRGTFHGFMDPRDMAWFIEYELTGTDAYAGYSALLHERGAAERMDVDGFVFPGGWPEYPEPVDIPAE